jgi:hypothetical protein
MLKSRQIPSTAGCEEEHHQSRTQRSFDVALGTSLTNPHEAWSAVSYPLMGLQL